MTDAEYQRRKRLKNMQGGASYHSEYPEFGELFVMLLKFLAEYFGSMFQGVSFAKSDENSQSSAKTAQTSNTIDPEVEDLLSGFTPSPTFMPMNAASRTATQLPVEEIDPEVEELLSGFTPSSNRLI